MEAPNWPTIPPAKPGRYWIYHPQYDVLDIGEKLFSMDFANWKTLTWGETNERTLMRVGVLFGPEVPPPNTSASLIRDLHLLEHQP